MIRIFSSIECSSTGHTLEKTDSYQRNRTRKPGWSIPLCPTFGRLKLMGGQGMKPGNFGEQ